jgi:hypothetical protein
MDWPCTSDEGNENENLWENLVFIGTGRSERKEESDFKI